MTEAGELIPSASVGNNKTWLDVAKKVILEVNSWVPDAMTGIHDIYYGTALPPNRTPLEITSAADRIGQTTFRVDPDKVVAVVETNCPDSASPLTEPDAVSIAIAGHVLEFFDYEVKAGRLPADSLLPLQAGIGNVANAVLGVSTGPLPRPDLLLRGHPGRDAAADQGRHRPARVGHVAGAVGGGHRRTDRRTSTSTATTSCCGRRRSATTRRSFADSASSR